MEQNNKKIMAVCYAIFSTLLAYVFSTLVGLLSAISGTIAQYTQGDFVQHVLPVLIGVGLFSFLQFSSKMSTWSEDVVTEIRKVVWRTPKETSQLTVVVCILLLVVGIFLSIVDMISAKVVNYLLTL